jgi:hypothetical protein
MFRPLGEERLILGLGPGIVILLQVCNRKVVENSGSLWWRRLMVGGRYQFAAAFFAFWRSERVSESARSADAIPYPNSALDSQHKGTKTRKNEQGQATEPAPDG